jgi:hypothetical protein
MAIVTFTISVEVEEGTPTSDLDQVLSDMEEIVAKKGWYLDNSNLEED